MSSLKLKHSGGNSVSLNPPTSAPTSSDVAFKLPNADGSAGQYLKTDGSGNLSFAAASGTTINNNADNRIITGSGTANTLEGESTFTYDGSGNVGIANSSGAVAVTVTTANNTDGGIYFTDGSDGNKGAISYLHTDDSMKFRANGTTKMTIDSSGNVGIGTTSPQEILHVKAASEAIGNRDGVIFGSTDSLAADKGLPLVWAAHIGTAADYGIASICGRKENSTSDNGAGYLQFGTGNAAGNISEIMRLTSSGTLAQTTGDTVYTASIAGAIRMQLIHTGGGDVTFSNPSSGSATYSTSSDYRLKQDVVDLPNAWSTVKALKPYEYKWKHNTSKTSQGFFAHEVIATVPNSQAGQGTKDAVDEDDKPIYQQIDYSKLVPVLTKALQEAITEIETLKTKVAALEAG